MTNLTKRLLTVLAGLSVCAAAHAQSTVGELLEKGGKRFTKEDMQAMLPYRIKWQWPNRQGEEELVLSVDGKITGSGYHFQSRSTSPAEGTWKLEDDGKLCAQKTFTTWNSSPSQCWYGFELGKDFFGAMKPDPDAKLMKVMSLVRLGAEGK